MLTVSMILGGKVVKGSVCETHFHRGGARIDADFEASTPVLPIGGEIATILSGALPQSAPLDLMARLVLQTNSDSGIRCGFTYSVEDLGAIRGMLNLRRAVRVRPSTALPLQAKVPEGVPVQVYDISTMGIALLLAEEEQGQLAGWTIRMSLVLPDQSAALDLTGIVRVRKLAGAAILYGIEFDGQRTADFSRKQELIHQYVMRRQAELLQERARRRSA